jgi:hypothetical protein
VKSITRLLTASINMETPQSKFAHETRIRDVFSNNLTIHRPLERLVKREVKYANSLVRADMRTVDQDDLLREWEFKLVANYSALGQILTYLSLIRREYKFKRQIRGVIAAFVIPPLIEETIETMNLGIELVRIPNSLRAAGNIPTLYGAAQQANQGLFIPNTNHLIFNH